MKIERMCTNFHSTASVALAYWTGARSPASVGAHEGWKCGFCPYSAQCPASRCSQPTVDAATGDGKLLRRLGGEGARSVSGGPCAARQGQRFGGGDGRGLPRVSGARCECNGCNARPRGQCLVSRKDSL